MYQMKELKLVVMDGVWTEWLDDYEAVSDRVRAVAATTEKMLLAEVKNADIVFGRLPREPFLAAKNLKWVQSCGVGFETMLYTEMVESDVVITNTAGAFDVAMAEHVLALILSWTRGVITAERNRSIRHYTRDISVSEIAGRRACVLGLGTIGRKISSHLHSLGMRISAVDAQVAVPPECVEELVKPNRIYEVLRKSEFVIVALPLTDGTRGLVDKKCFEAMPPHAYVVNIARGGIINERDLIKALQSGRIAGAGIDVYEEEPLPEDNPLWSIDNAVITPHLAGLSSEGHENMRKIFCENLYRYTNGEVLMNVVDKKRGYVIQSV